MAVLICPNCGCATSFSPVSLKGTGFLQRELADGTPKERLVMLSALTNRDEMKVQDVAYAIIVCQGCDKWFVAAQARHRSDWLAVHPIPRRHVAEEIGEPIKSQLEEAHLCFAVGAYTACLLVCRTALINMQRNQKVKNLDEMRDRGIITASLFAQANEVRYWANVAGHDDILPEDIEKEDVEHLLTFLEALLNEVYVNPKRVAALSEKRQ